MEIEPTDAGSDFALALLRAAVMLTDLADDLMDEIPKDAYPGEKPGAVFIEMVSGTIASAMGEADPGDVRRATELIAAACDRIVEHLELALELSRYMRGDAQGGPERRYG